MTVICLFMKPYTLALDALVLARHTNQLRMDHEQLNMVDGSVKLSS